MNPLSRTIRGWLVCTIVLSSLVLTAAPPTLAQEQLPTWQAWALAVDFPKQTLRVLYTTYVGRDEPTPLVLGSSTQDISKNCSIVSPTKQLTFDGDYAIFDGQTAIRCKVPSWRAEIGALASNLPGAHTNAMVCTAGRGPMFFHADVKLDSGSHANPIFDARRLGMVFSLPKNGNTVNTQVQLSSGPYLSPNWTANATAGNRMLMGMNGPTTVAVAAHFSWLKNLTAPAWSDYFSSQVRGPRMGHWIEAPNTGSYTNATSYTLRTTSEYVHIGYNEATGTYLRGKLRSGLGDPGCFSG